MSPALDLGEPDPFVHQLVSCLEKSTFVWRMAMATRLDSDPARRRSSITRMRNAEKEIREITFELVESEQVRQAVEKR